MRLSKKCGFGPIPPPPTATKLAEVQATHPFNTAYHDAYRDYIELHGLMTNLTDAEQAAIKPIAIAMQITKLSGGNIASAGNTTCMLQETTIGLVLPRLPRDCFVVIVKRRNSSSSRMTTTKYKRRTIERTLELLKKTNHPAWRDIQLSSNNAQAWDEDGDLADTLARDGNVVYEVDEDGTEVDGNAAPPLSGGNAHVDVFDDGGDRGPAELQNTEQENTTYEAVIHLGASTNVARDNADLAIAATVNAVRNFRSNAMAAAAMGQYDSDNDSEDELMHDLSDFDNPGPLDIRGGSDDVDASTAGGQQAASSQLPPHVQLNNGGATATVRQENIVTTVGFVDMFKRDWAFAQAFPTLFIPRPELDANGAVTWKIYHDFKGWEEMRTKEVDFTSWLDLQMWRSDGAPAAHGLFALICVNLKMKCALIKQGLYVLNTSGMDLSTTAEQITAAANDSELESQLKDMIQR